MKATGIVRRIDDLGRVVIPKEIRRTMRIREGDPLEIFTNNGEVIFKKYSPMGEMVSFATDLATALSQGTELSVIICDRERCIAVGTGAKTLIEKTITSELETLCEHRRIFVKKDGEKLSALDDTEQNICVVAPVLAAGDIIGCVVLLENEKSNTTEKISFFENFT
jgi:AbrB family transcriptional regulator (stage V sporulation protein T)